MNVHVRVVMGVGLSIAGSSLSGITAAATEAPQAAARPMRERLAAEATALESFVTSEVATRFLGAVPSLPAIESPRVAFRDRKTREAIGEAEAMALDDTARAAYERLELDETFYYTTRYGSPLAFVRPLDLIGRAGLGTLDGAHIVDFGFGSIGQLRLLAANGALAHGIEVDALLRILYGEPGDTGAIPRAPTAGTGPDGRVVLDFGRFPAERALVDAVGTGADVFVSKNTLKNGYIHPAESVDPRMLVHLGVSDSVFVDAVHTALAPGGYFMIYNLCPAQSEERYIPWADGRCPFARELLESSGFEVLAFDANDDEAARELGRRLGWDEQMDLDADLFGIYTLARRR